MTDLIRILKDFASYVRENRKYWLLPVMVTLFLLGFLIATAGTAPVPVFIYPVA